MLEPVVAFFERKLRNRIAAIMLSYLLAFLPFLAIILFFFNQSMVLFSELPKSREQIIAFWTQLMDWFSQKFQLDSESTSDWIAEKLINTLDFPMNLLRESFESGTLVIANIILIILITYFMLLYRRAFRNFLLAQVDPKNRTVLEQLFIRVKKLTKRYVIGQGLVIIILGVMIGSGLWLIGVPYAFFWGFLAGFLEIIPYVGTTIGGLLPFTYMLIVSDTFWQPWAVVILYIIAQQIEGNLISPNVMGSSIKVNPLFIIMGLFLGGYVWGISGMILALPILAVSKEVFRSFDALKPFSYLMEDGLSKKGGVFLEQFDSSRHRFLGLFFKEKPPEK